MLRHNNAKDDALLNIIVISKASVELTVINYSAIHKAVNKTEVPHFTIKERN